MIVLDIGVLIMGIVTGFCGYMLYQSRIGLSAARKAIMLLQIKIDARDLLILRMTHELEKHGCDDEFLIEEARKICDQTEPVEPPEYDPPGRGSRAAGESLNGPV